VKARELEEEADGDNDAEADAVLNVKLSVNWNA